MSIRGSVTLECDSKGCHAEEVIAAEDFNLADKWIYIDVSAAFNGWRVDDDGNIHCPQCCDEGRERGDDDGREYADPRDAREDRR